MELSIKNIEERIGNLEYRIGSSSPFSIPDSSFLEQLAALGAKITASVAQFKNVVADLITAKKVVVDEQFCLGSTCITETELKGLLQNANLAAVSSDGNEAVSEDVGTTTPQGAEPVFVLNGNNPAELAIGTVYSDMGATVTDPDTGNELGYVVFLNGILSTGVSVDTSVSGTHAIEYVATTQAGVTATTTRTVIVAGTAEPQNQNLETETESATTTDAVVESDSGAGEN